MLPIWIQCYWSLTPHLVKTLHSSFLWSRFFLLSWSLTIWLNTLVHHQPLTSTPFVSDTSVVKLFQLLVTYISFISCTQSIYTSHTTFWTVFLMIEFTFLARNKVLSKHVMQFLQTLVSKIAHYSTVNKTFSCEKIHWFFLWRHKTHF